MIKGKILIVEDDKKIADVLKDYFIKENFNVSISGTGEKVVGDVKNNMPDLILLDIMLPDKDGITICREIRSFSDVPIIFVTAKVQDVDRLLGLELGADDYICKPFLPQEVVARVKAVIRRTRPDRERNRLVVGTVNMDDEIHEVRVDGTTVDLTPIEYNLLKIMMIVPDKVFTRADLLSAIHGYGYYCYERTIDNHIKNLRKKINSHLPNQEIINTVHGVGYKIGSSQYD
jgi:two-component system, OmpR family, response regulator BaeR